jgi:hypothetical protein
VEAGDGGEGDCSWTGAAFTFVSAMSTITMAGLEGAEMIGLWNQLVRTRFYAAFSQQPAKRVYIPQSTLITDII